MFRNRLIRIMLTAVLAAFAWAMLSTWPTDSPKVRVAGSMMVALALPLAGGVAAPTRGRFALRVGAGIIGLAYVGYFVIELWQLLRGDRQPLRAGEPSATMAGIGVLIYAVPMLIFAASGYPGSRYRSLYDFLRGRVSRSEHENAHNER
jgi:hypothetical protein